jgi:hypothetical protein
MDSITAPMVGTVAPIVGSVFVILFILSIVLIVIGSRKDDNKLEKIRNSKVVRVSGSKYQYGIPWSNYGDGKNKIEVIFPILENKGWLNDEKLARSHLWDRECCRICNAPDQL